MEDCLSKQYLTEWPPPDTKQSLKRTCDKSIHDNEAKKYKSSDDPEPSSVDLSLTTADPTVLPDVLLSRWWKKRRNYTLLVLHQLSSLQEDGTSSCNPRTLLYHIAKLPEGQAILTERISYLKQKLSDFHNSSENTWKIHYNLASCYHSLGSDLHNTDSALVHAREALELQAREPDVEWLLEQLIRQRAAEERKHAMESLLLRGDCVLMLPKTAQVERRCASELSLEQFISEYALTHTPLVITGLVDHMTTPSWTLAYVKKVIGHKVAPLKRMVEGSVEWARLEPAGQSTVAQFIDSLDSQQDLCYLFDWSLPLNCPELVSELSIPKYFANDFLQRTPEGSLYRDSWPSLFIAPAGITSELHVDAFGSNFWMALFEGRKRWVFFPPEDTPLLYPLYANSTDAIFQANLSSPNLSLHPLLASTHPRECVLEAGEVLYVPAGCPHRVENLEKSLAISANFVDCSNFDLVKKELFANALVDEHTNELLRVLQTDGFDTQMRGLDKSLPGAIRNNLAQNGSSKESEGETLVHQAGKAHDTEFCPTSSEREGLRNTSLCLTWTHFKDQIA